MQSTTDRLLCAQVLGAIQDIPKLMSKTQQPLKRSWLNTLALSGCFHSRMAHIGPKGNGTCSETGVL